MLPNTPRSFCSICLTSTLVMLGSALQVHGYDFVWSAAGDGDWTTPANWNPSVGFTGFPNAAELDVSIYGSLPAMDTTVNITLNQEVTFGKLYVRANTNRSNFIFSGSGSFVVNNGASPGDIGFAQGSTGGFHSIDVPISVVSDTLNLSGRQGGITGNITAVSGNDLTINWGGGNVITLSGDNNFNNGTIISAGSTNSTHGIRFADSATAAGGPNTTIQLNDGNVQFQNSNEGTDVDFGNSIEVSGTGISTLAIPRLLVNNAITTTSITLGDITLNAGSTLQYTRPDSGSSTTAPRVRVGSGHNLTLGDNSTLHLNGTFVQLIDVMDQSLLQGTGTVQISEDNTTSRVRVLAGGTVRPGDSSDTGILNIGSDTVQGRLEMQEDSTMRFRLNGTTAGSDYDQLRFGDGPSGESSLMAAADSVLLELELNFAYDASDVVFIIRNDQEMALTDGDFFQDFSQGDTITFSEGTFAGSTALISYEADYDTNLTTGGYSVALYGFSVIPEPSSAGLLIGAFALGLTFSRRRRL